MLLLLLLTDLFAWHTAAASSSQLLAAFNAITPGFLECNVLIPSINSHCGSNFRKNPKFFFFFIILEDAVMADWTECAVPERTASADDDFEISTRHMVSEGPNLPFWLSCLYLFSAAEQNVECVSQAKHSLADGGSVTKADQKIKK